MDEKRFTRIYAQGISEHLSIWVDKETGINYLIFQFGYAGGVTVLLDSEGKTVVTPIK